MVGMVVGAAVQILDMILKYTSKNPATTPQFSGAVRGVLAIVSRVTEETPAETAARLADHDAAVALYAAAPPPGVNP